MKPLRIGIACYPTYGGSGVMATELGLALADRGHEVHLFSYARPSRLPACHPGLEFHGVSVSEYPLFRFPPYDLALSSALREVMQQRGLDIVHAHYAVPHALCAYLAREMVPGSRTKIVTTLHGTDITLVGADRSYLPITKYALEQSDGVTAISNYLKQATIEHFGFDRIEVIPNFVCPDDYKPKIDCDLRESLSPDGAPVMVHVSNFRPVKRPVDCVEILARVLKKTKARLVMVGDGSERTNCIHRARCLGISDNCVFVGKQPNIVDYLCASDVLLLPSEQESFGLAALEAMAVQVPVIASRVGGLPELIDDGETGFLSAVGDVDKMADDAARLLMDPKFRKEMGKRARASAIDRYSTHKIIPQYIEFYERILAGK